MKLWLKVSLCAVVMVTLSTTACSLLLLLRSGQSNLNLAIDNALANQQIRAALAIRRKRSNLFGFSVLLIEGFTVAQLPAGVL